MNKEEILKIIKENINKIADMTDKLCYLDNETRVAFDLEMEIAGIFSTNLWLQNNLDISDTSDFQKRLSAYENILNDGRYQNAFRKVEVAGDISLYQKLGKEFSDKISNYFSNLDASKKSSFLEGVLIIKELLSDSTIKDKEEVCHFKLFGDHVDNHSNIIDVYKMFLANERCLFHLKDIERDLLEENVSKKSR